MKFPNDYFRQLFQRKMRKQPGGAEMQLIYLKMLLYSIDKDARIQFQSVYDTIEEEIAEELGEDAEIVKDAVAFLEANQKLERTEKGIILPEALERVGSEGLSAERVRNFRQRKASHSDHEALQCNTTVTECDDDVTNGNVNVLHGNVDIEIDIDKEKDIEIDIDTDKEIESEEEKKKPHKKKVATSAYVVDPELNTAICDFIEHRKKMRKPMTDKAIELFIQRLQGMADNVPDQISLINTAIERGWMTVYPPKDEQRKTGTGQPDMTVNDYLLGVINGQIKTEGDDFF